MSPPPAFVTHPLYCPVFRGPPARRTTGLSNSEQGRGGYWSGGSQSAASCPSSGNRRPGSPGGCLVRLWRRNDCSIGGGTVGVPKRIWGQSPQLCSWNRALRKNTRRRPWLSVCSSCIPRCRCEPGHRMVLDRQARGLRTVCSCEWIQACEGRRADREVRNDDACSRPSSGPLAPHPVRACYLAPSLSNPTALKQPLGHDPDRPQTRLILRAAD
jgi:hypothetical protein